MPIKSGNTAGLATDCSPGWESGYEHWEIFQLAHYYEPFLTAAIYWQAQAIRNPRARQLYLCQHTLKEKASHLVCFPHLPQHSPESEMCTYSQECSSAANKAAACCVTWCSPSNAKWGFLFQVETSLIVFHTLIQLAPIAPFPAAEGCRRWQHHWFCSGYPIISSSVTSCNWAFSAALHCFAHFICWLCCSCILSVLYCNNLIKMSISAQHFGEHLNHNHTQE